MNATAAKFDIKNASAADLVSRLSDLQEKAADHNTPDTELDKIHKEIADIYAAIRNLKKNRVSELEQIQTKLKTFDFNVKEVFGDNALTLFSDHELTLEAQHRGLFKAKAAATGETKTRSAPKKIVYASANNPILLTAPKIATDHHKVKDDVMHQGRINELPYSVSTPLLRAAGKDEAETIKNLMKLVDPASAEYVKKDEGKAELAKIAKAILKAKAAKGTAAAPHNEAQADMNKAAA